MANLRSRRPRHPFVMPLQCIVNLRSAECWFRKSNQQANKMRFHCIRPCVFGRLRLALLIFALLSNRAFAQELKGAISGTVTDESGAVLQGAQITIDSADIKVVSTEQGSFMIKGLAPGTY